MKFLVKVNKSHIAAGKIGEPRCCPIALAMNECFQSTSKAEVYREVFDVVPRGRMRMTNLPLAKNATVFIDKFDGKQPVKPFQFTINIPEGNK